MLKTIIYLPIKPEIAKEQNLPLKLPVLAEDFPLITEMNRIPLDVIIRGLEAQYEIEKIDYWKSYLSFFYYEKFKEQLNIGNFESCKEFLEKAKNIMYDYRYHFYFALFYVKQKNYEIAEVELKQALAMNPHSPLVFFELGNLLFLKKEYEEALEMYEKCVRLEPDFTLPIMKIGDIYLENGQLKDAEFFYLKVLEKEKIPEVFLRLGVLYNLQQRYEKAEMVFKQGLKYGDNPEIKYNLAYALTRNGKHLEAYSILLELSKLSENEDVLNELALVQKNIGLYEEALENIAKVKEKYLENYKTISLLNGIEFPDFKNPFEGLESKLEKLDFPFKNNLNTILEITDDNGYVVPGLIKEILGVEPVNQDIEDTNLTYIGLLLAGIYIAGDNPYLMERNATLITVSLMGTGLPLAASRVILRTYQNLLLGADFEEFFGGIIKETSELHYKFARKIAKEINESITQNDLESESLSNFVILLLKLTKNGFKNIDSLSENKLEYIKFFRDISKL